MYLAHFAQRRRQFAEKSVRLFFIFFNKDSELIQYEVTVSVLARAQHTQCCSNRVKTNAKREQRKMRSNDDDDDVLLYVYENGWIVLKKCRDSLCTAIFLLLTHKINSFVSFIT